MARNLRAKISIDDTILVYDLNKPVLSRFAKEAAAEQKIENAVNKQNRNNPPRDGGKCIVAASPEELVLQSETIITMLPEPKHVLGLFEQLSNPKSGLNCQETGSRKLFLDCSTIDITTSLEVGHLARFSGLHGDFVDAPVSGGVVGATRGTLTFMVGAQDYLLERVSEVLCYMGSRVLHCGPPGTGLAGKLANNYLLAISNIATAEAMNLGVKMGLNPYTLKDLINVSSGKCWSSEVNNPIDNLHKDFVGGFGTALMLKDLKLAMAAAEKCSAKLELARTAREVYENTMVASDCKNRDFSVVYRYLGGEEVEEESGPKGE